MRKLLAIGFILAGITGYSQTSLVHTVATKVQLKALNTSATKVFVSDSNAFYSVCSPCTVDEVYVIAGQSGKKWQKVAGVGIIVNGSSIDTTSLSNRVNLRVRFTDTASMLSPYLRKLDTAALSTRINTKQATLVSGTNIKTVNGSSLLGSGDLAIAGGGSALSALTDITLTSPKAGSTLRYDSVAGKWKNMRDSKYDVKIIGGAKGDGKQYFDCSMNVGSPILLTTSPHFTGADVGKTIEVAGVGASGRPLTSTIVTYNNASSVTLAHNASASAALQRFAYGTDDQDAIQYTIDKCYNEGGGTVWFPNGVYFLSKGLVNSYEGTNPNCQLTIPTIGAQPPTTAYWANRRVVVFEGETPPNMSPASIGDDFTPSYVGVVLKSTVSGSGINPAVIGTKAADPYYQNINFNYISIKNISILVSMNTSGTGPTVGGINAYYAGSLITDNVVVCIDGSLYRSANPIAETAGIVGVQNNSEAFSRLTNTLAIGFRYGIVAGEHTSMDQVGVYGCFAGLVPQPNTQLMEVGRLNIHWCTNAIFIPNVTTLGIPAGNTYFNIDALNVEAMNAAGPLWFNQYRYIVSDSGNLGKGNIRYHITRSYFGVDYSLFNKNGATNIVCDQLGTSAGSAPQWADITNGIRYTAGNLVEVRSGTANPQFVAEATAPANFSAMTFKTDQGVAGNFVAAGSAYSDESFVPGSVTLTGWQAGGLNFTAAYPGAPIRFYTDDYLAANKRLEITSAGLLNYATDKSSIYTARSVVDKAYVDAAAGTWTITSGNLYRNSKVMIGSTSAPSGILHIKSTFAPSYGQFTLQDPVSSGAASTIYSTYYDASNTRLAIQGFGRYAGASDPNFYFANEQTAGGIVFRNNSSDIFTIANNGQITSSSLAGAGGVVLASAGGVLSVGSAPVSYTDEQAQDAVGAMVSSEFNYVDGTPLLAINTIAQSKVTGLIDTLAKRAILVGGIVPASQLPASVVGIVTVANFAALPGTGAANTIYITSDNNKRYIYSTTYIELGATPPVTSVNSATGDVVLTAASVGAVPTSRTLTINGTALALGADRSWSVGTVTGTSVTAANGFTGSFATSTTTPALTIGTTVTGILKGNGTAVSAAVAGDFPTLNQSTTGTASNVTGVVGITNGGTGQATAAAGFNALSPITTLGDIVYGSGTNTSSRLAGTISATKQFLTQTGNGTISAAPSWGTIAAGDVPTLNQNTTGTAGNITGVLNATSFPALTGDVITSSGSVATTISGLSLTKLQNISTGTILGRSAVGTGGVEILSTLPTAVMPAHTGDVTSSAGSLGLTLATVNSNTGAWGSATQVPTFTVNAKGLITAASNTAIAIAESQVTSLVSDLALKAPLASPTFTGTVTVPDGSFGVLKLSATGTKDATTYLAGDNTWKAIPGGGGSGTVTTVSVATANGFAGSVTNPTTTPAITITTGVTGILKGNGTAVSAAVAGDFPTLNQSTTGTAANLSGTPALPNGTTATTQSAANNSTAIATTAYVDAADALKANLASPTFTGTPAAPTAAAATNTTQLATTAFVEQAITRKSYNTIAEASASHTAARVAGTYALGDGDPAAISGTGTLYPVKIIRINGADYPTTDGITTKLSLQVNLAVNDVAPTGNYTFGLYPITRPATSGGAGLDIYTLGTVVTGSTGLFTAPAADGLLTITSSDFAIPADGFYVIGFVSTAAVATSSHLHMSAFLRYRNN